MNNALPAALVGLTALVTSGLVHAGYSIWWLSQALIHGYAAAFDWTGALTASGTASAVVLIAALVARRLFSSHAPEQTDIEPVAVSARGCSEAVR